MRGISTLLVLLSISISLQSQMLDQSIWRVFTETGNFFRYIQFADDSMYQSSDNASYSAFAFYEENSNKIQIIDLPGACDVMDTGFYDFQLKDDSVLFTYVKDSCYNRYQTMALYDWVDLASGLEEKLYDYPELNYYPNPANDYLIISFGKMLPDISYSISDLRGRVAKTGWLNSPESRIDVSTLPEGLYILSIDNNAIRKHIMIE